MGWYPQENLTRLEALKGFTLSAAYASFQENKLGSIEVGKYADFVIYDKDWMDEGIVENPREILEIRPRMVVLGGRCVYEKK